MQTIILETLIDSTIEICFDLSRSIDLHIETSKDTKEKAIAGKISGLIGLHEQVTWQAFHLGVSQKLSSKITAFNKPIHFRDEQVEGIFKYFKHDHSFIKVNDKILMKDTFVFKFPFRILGSLFSFLFLKNYW